MLVCTLVLVLVLAVLWRAMISRANGIVTSALDISSLSKISDGYTMSQMAQCCSQARSSTPPPPPSLQHTHT